MAGEERQGHLVWFAAGAEGSGSSVLQRADAPAGEVGRSQLRAAVVTC